MDNGQELRRFSLHMKRVDTGKRALVIEPTSSHQETIPSLVYYFNRLGFGVDVLLSPFQQDSRKIEPYLKGLDGPDVNFFYALDIAKYAYLAKVINAAYEFVYFNTLYEVFSESANHHVFAAAIRSRKIMATVHNYSTYREKMHLFPEIQRSSLFVLNPYVAKETGLRSLSPSMFYSGQNACCRQRAMPEFLCVGEVNGARRDYDQLIDAGIVLGEKGMAGTYSVTVTCPASSLSYYDQFLDNIRRYSLEDSIRVFENMPFKALFSLASSTPYMLFLMNKRSQRNLCYLKEKITGGINIALGFGIVPVVEKVFAEEWGISSCSLTYEGVEGLVGVIADIVKDPELCRPHREMIFAKNEQLLAESLENLASVLNVPVLEM